MDVRNEKHNTNVPCHPCLCSSTQKRRARKTVSDANASEIVAKRSCLINGLQSEDRQYSSCGPDANNGFAAFVHTAQ